MAGLHNKEIVMKKNTLIAVLLSATLYSTAHAGTVPVGVQHDISTATLSSWGWSQIYSEDYAVNGVTVDSMFAGHGDYVMIGAQQDGTDVLHVAAAILWTDFITATLINQTNEFNGAEWYNNTYSLGFAALGDTISQSSADTSNTNAASRLSWHTDNTYPDPASPSIGGYIAHGGWRAGEFIGLNNSTDWNRVIYTMDAVSAVPIPAALFMFAPALLGFFGFRRKMQA